MKSIEEFMNTKEKLLETQTLERGLANQIGEYLSVITIAFIPLYVKESKNSCIDKERKGLGLFTDRETQDVYYKVRSATFKLNKESLFFYGKSGYSEYPIFSIKPEFLNKLFKLYSEGKIDEAIKLSYKCRAKDIETTSKLTAESDAVRKNNAKIRELVDTSKTLKELGVKEDDAAIVAINTKIKEISESTEKLRAEPKYTDLNIVVLRTGHTSNYMWPNGDERR